MVQRGGHRSCHIGEQDELSLGAGGEGGRMGFEVLNTPILPKEITHTIQPAAHINCEAYSSLHAFLGAVLRPCKRYSDNELSGEVG